MPKSKRATRVSLTQTTTKKTRDHKTKYVDTVRSAIDDADRIYLFSYENMRSTHFKDVRCHFRTSSKKKNAAASSATMNDDDDDDDGGGGRLFLGKNRLLQIALGRTAADEYSDNVSRMSTHITGSVGILCTSMSRAAVEGYFASLAMPEYAKCGTICPMTITITSEYMISDAANYPACMMELLRKLGLPVEVRNGSLVLAGGRTSYVVCTKGEELTAEQCKILVHMRIKLSVFRINLLRRWEKKDGAIEELCY